MNNNIIYNSTTNTLKCPRCGSESIYVKCGMIVDLYTCNDCGFESRDVIEI